MKTFTTLGSGLLLAICLPVASGCTGSDTDGNDIESFADVQAGDSLDGAGDVGPDSGATVDTVEPADTVQSDTVAEDTLASDTVAVDTETPDTVLVDTVLVDTVLVDTVLVDTVPADTFELDTSSVDTVAVDTVAPFACVPGDDDNDCDAGETCVVDLNATVDDTVCVPTSCASEDCAAGYVCDEGDICASAPYEACDPLGLPCVADHACSSALEVCVPEAAGVACDVVIGCGSGFECTGGFCVPGIGQPCNGSVCSTGLVCEANVCVSEAGRACPTGICESGYACVGSPATCVGAVGAACAPSAALPVHCLAALECDAGVCRLPPGADCSSGTNACTSGYGCIDDGTPTCDGVTAGVPCGDSVTCAAPLECDLDAEVCLAGAGASCAESSCAKGRLCIADVCIAAAARVRLGSVSGVSRSVDGAFSVGQQPASTQVDASGVAIDWGFCPAKP